MRDEPAPYLPPQAALEGSWLEYLSAFDGREEQAEGRKSKAPGIRGHSAASPEDLPLTPSSVLIPQP
jgi:hypothetical protein